MAHRQLVLYIHVSWEFRLADHRCILCGVLIWSIWGEVDSPEEVTVLPSKKCGRPFLIGDLERQLRLYILKLREQGGVITSSVVVAAAYGHVTLSTSWAYHFLEPMSFARRKTTTTKFRQKPQNFEAMKETFLADIVAVVEMEEIPPELILNMDQTGIKLVPARCWTMAKVGSRRVEITGVGQKRQVTAVVCGSLTGDYLPTQLIYQGKSNHCHPNFNFPEEWHITHSLKHWAMETTMIAYLNNIVVPYIEATRNLLKLD